VGDGARATPTSLATVLESLGLEVHGQLHSGVDDSTTIATCMIAIIGRNDARAHVNDELFHSCRTRLKREVRCDALTAGLFLFHTCYNWYRSIELVVYDDCL